MKKLFAIALLSLTGCGHYVYHVYGQSGKSYTSVVDSCAAVAACVQAGEQSCYYAHSKDFSCKEVEKK
jgi:hypothetical protein